MKYRIALLLAGLALALPVMGQTQLNGAGATFPYPMYSKWFSDYNKLHPDVQINYQSIGSGGGIRQVLEWHRRFRSQRWPHDGRATERGEDEDPAHSHRLGAVVPAYNIAGVSGEIKFTPEALAGIFLGKIRTGTIRQSQKPTQA